MKSKGIQYWTLLVVSCGVVLLYVAEMIANHSIVKEQRFLQDQNQIATTGPYFKDAWQKLATEVWKGGQTDPALDALLKSEGIIVRQGPPPGSAGATNAAPPAPTPATNSPSAKP